uniref:Uncharacterized protein n=1 Tax=Bracon brevicornis TaxID=1563983 RepID=A0A6V7LM05_9HYME
MRFLIFRKKPATFALFSNNPHEPEISESRLVCLLHLWNTLCELLPQNNLAFVLWVLNIYSNGYKSNGDFADDNKHLRNTAKELGRSLMTFNPTHHSSKSANWIDVILLNNDNLVTRTFQEATAMSGHDLIGIAVKRESKSIRICPGRRSFRDYTIFVIVIN